MLENEYLDCLYLSFPFGFLKLRANSSYLLEVSFIKEIPLQIKNFAQASQNPILQEATKELQAYFDRKLFVFDLPLDFRGFSPFCQKVFDALCQIPYGQTRSYKEIASYINIPYASRAIGRANSKNPYLIIVPCHRVIKSNGAIGGYLGCDSHPLKSYLLALEQSKF